MRCLDIFSMKDVEYLLRKEGLLPGTPEYKRALHERFDMHDATDNSFVARADNHSTPGDRRREFRYDVV